VHCPIAANIMRAIRGALCIALLVSATGCASSNRPGQSTETTDPANGDWSHDDEPLYAAVANQLGYRIDAIAAASDKYTKARLSDCLVTKGYDSSAVPESLPADIANSTAGGATSAAIRAVNSAQPAVKSAAIALPADVLTGCESEASLEAVAGLEGLLSNAIAEVSDRAKADSVYISAVRKKDSCVQKLGFDPSSIMSKAFQDDSDAMEVYVSFAAGTISRDLALLKLSDIRVRTQHYSSSLQELNLCGSALTLVERQVVAKAQRQYLDNHPGFVAGIADEFRPVMAVVTSYLPQKR
jgi:hypothetical protein